MHYSQLINHLQQEGKLLIHHTVVTQHTTIHVTWVVSVAMEALRAAIGGVDIETENHGRGSFCCGAGGAQMWMEEHADEGYDRVNIIRAKELASTGADTVAVGCPSVLQWLQTGCPVLNQIWK